MGLAEEFTAWTREVRPSVFESAHRFSQDPALAEVAVVDALGDAWLRREVLSEEGMTLTGFQAYLITAARHFILRHWRDRDRQESLLRAGALRAKSRPPSGLQEEVWRLIQLLPEDARRVMIWHVYDGLGYAEIGRRLDPSLQTPSAQCKCGKRRVGEALDLFRKLAFLEGFDPAAWV